MDGWIKGRMNVIDERKGGWTVGKLAGWLDRQKGQAGGWEDGWRNGWKEWTEWKGNTEKQMDGCSVSQ